MGRPAKASNAIVAKRRYATGALSCWSTATPVTPPRSSTRSSTWRCTPVAFGIPRVLHVSPTTVIKELKKKEPELQSVNHSVLASVQPEQVEIEIGRADELEVRRGLSSELDEMWGFVQAKAHPRWLWHAIEHHTGKVLAYVFGRRKDAVFLKLQQLLEPFGITKFYTDGWGAYERHIDAKKHHVGKENTQKIESKHINLRT